jgi:tryptophanyl-tRNA synthetase
MSKSYNNTIELGEAPKSVEAKIKRMFTDPLKLKVDDKGHPEGCVVFAFHKIYNTAYAARENECRGGAIGCGACKKHLFELMAPSLEAFAVRRAAYEGSPEKVDELLAAGSSRVRTAAAAALARINAVLKL